MRAISVLCVIDLAVSLATGVPVRPSLPLTLPVAANTLLVTADRVELLLLYQGEGGTSTVLMSPLRASSLVLVSNERGARRFGRPEVTVHSYLFLFPDLASSLAARLLCSYRAYINDIQITTAVIPGVTKSRWVEASKGDCNMSLLDAQIVPASQDC